MLSHRICEALARNWGHTGSRRTTVFCSIVLASVVTIGSINALGEEIQLVNPSILGCRASTNVQFFLDAPSQAVRAMRVCLDIEDGYFSGVTVIYPESITLDQAKRSLNARYKEWERKSFADDQTMGLWRNEKEKFAIQLTVDEEGVRLIYLPFQAERSDE
jgi:hypothetical protein